VADADVPLQAGVGFCHTGSNLQGLEKQHKQQTQGSSSLTVYFTAGVGIELCKLLHCRATRCLRRIACGLVQVMQSAGRAL